MIDIPTNTEYNCYIIRCKTFTYIAIISDICYDQYDFKTTVLSYSFIIDILDFVTINGLCKYLN